MTVEPKKTSDRAYYLFALKIMGNFGVSLAVPVVALVLLGQWLDEKYNTRPWFLAIGFTLAAVTSAKIIYNKAKQYGREYQEMNKK